MSFECMEQVIAPDGRHFTLIDTAGIRKRARVSDSVDGAEPLSVSRAIAAVRCAHGLARDALDPAYSAIWMFLPTTISGMH